MTTLLEHSDDWNQVSLNMIDKKIDQDRYQLVEELGRGSYGCLFLGQSLIDNSYVAIKILSKKGLNETQLKLQQLEVDIQSSLKHPYLLTLDHVVQQEEYIFMIMELCDGGDLFEFVINKQQHGYVKDTFIQILDAIEYMHQSHIYHRDIKLENVLLQSHHQQRFICKVADFGLATKERYSLEFGCGSTTYLAPEHFGSEEGGEEEEQEEFEPYDAAASDIWSLGILLLALLFGRNPWQEATLMDHAFAEFKQDSKSLKFQLFPELTNECLNLLQDILCLNPAQRPSVSEIKSRFMKLDKLTIDYDDNDYDEDDIMISPLDIHPVPPNKSNKASYDSAIFSQDGRSWSDMVEEDELQQQIQQQQQQVDPIAYDVEDVEEEDIFIHSQEKESWWL